MRNLSKVLALVLSLAFVMTMFAGAIVTAPAVTDSDSLSAAGKEAVTVLGALDVVSGYADGTYAGDKLVTRAEYAKLIAVASNGTDTTPFFDTDSLKFTDYVDAWAKPYINYCYLNGILAGFGDGTVKASANVTGVQALKMTLVALNYDPEIEGLVGSKWIENTVTLADRAGLLKNLEGKNLYADFDREATAILIYNALFANTVTYYGNTAVANEYTLGEEVFDLLDVRAIVVANDNLGLGMTYSYVVDKAQHGYIKYAKANANTTTVVYRDYSDAATTGGYYTPRAITLNIDSANSDLGKVYRVLTTGVKTPYNTTEVRKVYAVLETSYGYTEGYAKDDLKLMDKANAMLDVAGVTKIGNILIDDVISSAAELQVWYNTNKKSNSPVVLIDNDGDAIMDTIKVYTRSYHEVLAANDGKYLVNGKWREFEGEIAVGDYFRYDDLYGYVKLDAKSGMITTASNTTWTIDGMKLDGDCASAGVMGSANIATVLGGGIAAAGVNATIIYDDGYAVAAKLNDTNSWANYGIVIGWNNNTYLGLRSIRLFTADNKYVDYTVTSVNGNQNYDEIVNYYTTNIPANTLVKYYVTDNTVALYTLGTDLTIGTKDMNGDADYSATFDRWYLNGTATDGTNINGTYTWKEGYIFAAIAGQKVSNVDYAMSALQWRAYKWSEFQPVLGFDGASAQLVVDFYNNIIKVGAVIGEAGQTLPGLVLGGDTWLTLTAAPSFTYSTETGYTYTIKTLVPGTYPNVEETKTLTSKTPLNVATLTKGDIVRATIDENNVVTYWQPVENKNDLGTNGIEISELNVVDITTNELTGITYFHAINNMSLDGTPLFYQITENTKFVWGKNLWTTSFAKEDRASTLELMLALAVENNWAIYADVNPTTLELNTVWIDTAFRTTTVGTITLTSYNTATKTATYVIAVTDPAYRPHDTITLTETQNPEDLWMKVGETESITLTLDVAAEIVDYTIADSTKVTLSTDLGDQYFVLDTAITTRDGADGDRQTVYNLDDHAQFFWNRTWNGRVDAMSADDTALTVIDSVLDWDVIDNFKRDNVNNSINFEYVIITDADGDGDYDIVDFFDTYAGPEDDNAWPYVGLDVAPIAD